MAPRLKLFLPLILFVVLALFLFRGLSLDPRAMPSALIDKPFPTFALPALQREQTLDRSLLLGKVSLVNIWATWCISCRVEHPYLNQLTESGVHIVGVNYKDDSEAAKRWLEDLGDPYSINIVDAEGNLGLDLGVYGAPETYFVDVRGVIRYRHVGVIDERVWNSKLAAIYREIGGELPQQLAEASR